MAKGFDVRVNVEGLVKVLKPAKGPTREMPSHGDVMHDFRSKLAARPGDRAVLYDAIDSIDRTKQTGEDEAATPRQRVAAFWSELRKWNPVSTRPLLHEVVKAVYLPR